MKRFLFTKFLFLCNCIQSAAIEDIPTDDCIERFGEFRFAGLQRLKNGSALNEMNFADAALLLTWNNLKTATDSTKVQFTPDLQENTNEEGEPRTTGGGNATTGGVPVILGENPSPYTGYMKDVKQAVIEKIKTYRCEKKLAVYLVNANGQIGGLVDDHTTPTKFRPIPIEAFFVGSKKLGFYEGQDTNKIQWQFKANWSDKFKIITPTDFNALDVLQN